MRFSRRQFLRSTLLLLGYRGGSNALVLPQPDDDLTGHIRPVHDPCIIRAGGTYYLFCTGPGIPIRTSTDLIHWELRGDVFDRLPSWAVEQVPGTEGFWAPDISYFNDRYHLYYSISTFGSNRSRIGLATTPTLDPAADDYQWVDHGLVIASEHSDDWNAIDANLFMDEDGSVWLLYGSFWSGIKMRRLDYATGMLSADDTTLYDLATRTENSGSVEAPFLIRRGDYYYLFVSFDFCCRGYGSTYRVMVGRADAVTGPYVDREGVAMLRGGGTQVTFATPRWRGPGHNAILQEGDETWIVYHSYDTTYNSIPTLRIQLLVWDDDGWPSIPEDS